MRKLGIIQPGKIGDIIICLPIAKWYHDRGYEIIWPLDKNIIKNFIDYVSYVTFYPINFDCNEARMVCFNEGCNSIIDVSFTIPGGHKHNSNFYLSQTEMEFDELKYKIANVPFEEKWNLHFDRKLDREQSLFDKIVKQPKYTVVQWQGSTVKKQITLDNPDNHQIIEIQPITESVFDWITILEKATWLVLIDSSVANLVEQLNLPVKKYFLTRQKAQPNLRQDWIVI
jgi:hypothetical protein